MKMIRIKKIEVGLYAIAIKKSEVANNGNEKFLEFYYKTKAYLDSHTYVGYVILLYERPEVRDISLVLARVMGYKTAVEIPEVLMVEGRSLRK